jgi:predicted MPP superfamily phosphohydrolase
MEREMGAQGARVTVSEGTAAAPSDWEVRPVPRCVVAIGDLHGDVRAFGAIARTCGLVDERGNWSGGDTHLVLMGDLVGGPRSRLLLNAVMRLEREALRDGGRVHALLGNHDLLPVAGRFGRMSAGERRTYQRGDFQGDGPYAEWMRSRPAFLKIGDTAFVHAGLEDWALETDPAELNAHVLAWIAHRQGKGPRPPKDTRWAIDDEGGPMWTRSFR